MNKHMQITQKLQNSYRMGKGGKRSRLQELQWRCKMMPGAQVCSEYYLQLYGNTEKHKPHTKGGLLCRNESWRIAGGSSSPGGAEDILPICPRVRISHWRWLRLLTADRQGLMSDFSELLTLVYKYFQVWKNSSNAFVNHLIELVSSNNSGRRVLFAANSALTVCSLLHKW